MSVQGLNSFDQVQLRDRRLSIAQFLNLPLEKRVEGLLGGEVHFFLNGQPVESTQALKELRSWRAGTHPT